MAGFDAYHKWLGIPPSEQPPNHYRLLGLGLYESDPDVIQSAADRQMAHVKTYKNGPQSDLSQQILNEIAAAKLCLLKPQKKAQYDAELRAKAGAAGLPPVFVPPGVPQVAPPTAAPRPAAGPPPLPAGQTATVAARSPAPLTRASGGATAVAPGMTPPPPTIRPAAAPPPLAVADDDRPTNMPLAAGLIAGSVVLVVLFVWLVIRFSSGGSSANDPHVAVNTQNQPSPIDDPSPGSTNPNVSPDKPVTATGNPQNTTQPPAPTQQENPIKENPPKNVANPSGQNTTGTNSTAPDKTTTGAATGNTVKPPPGVNTPPKKPAIAPGQKIAVPDAAALADGQKQYAEKASEATAASLLKLIVKWDDAGLVYVALNHALEMAIADGDIATVGAVIDAINERFAVDPLALRLNALEHARLHISTNSGWDTLSLTAGGLVDEAVAAGRRDDAIRLATLGLIAARKTGSSELMRKATLQVIDLQAGGAGKKVPKPTDAVSDVQ